MACQHTHITRQVRLTSLAYPLSCLFFKVNTSNHWPLLKQDVLLTPQPPWTNAKAIALYVFFPHYGTLCFYYIIPWPLPSWTQCEAGSLGASAAQNWHHLGYFLFDSITNVPIPASERVVLTSTLCIRARPKKMVLPPAFSAIAPRFFGYSVQWVMWAMSLTSGQ